MIDGSANHRIPEHDPFAIESRRRLRERLRAEWIAGAEDEWRRRTGRTMTSAELERLLRRFPGDI